MNKHEKKIARLLIINIVLTLFFGVRMLSNENEMKHKIEQTEMYSRSSHDDIESLGHNVSEQVRRALEEGAYLVSRMDYQYGQVLDGLVDTTFDILMKNNSDYDSYVLVICDETAYNMLEEVPLDRGKALAYQAKLMLPINQEYTYYIMGKNRDSTQGIVSRTQYINPNEIAHKRMQVINTYSLNEDGKRSVDMMLLFENWENRTYEVEKVELMSKSWDQPKDMTEQMLTHEEAIEQALEMGEHWKLEEYSDVKELGTPFYIVYEYKEENVVSGAIHEVSNATPEGLVTNITLVVTFSDGVQFQEEIW